MQRNVRSPLDWVGSKSRLLGWLLPLITTGNELYCEPFGGSAAVLLNHRQVRIEVLNDLDGNVVNLLRCLARHRRELQRYLRLVPYSREVYKSELAWLRAGQPGSMTDIERAARFWWFDLASFGGIIGAGFGTAATEPKPTRVHQHIRDVEAAAERLHDVLFEQDDFRVVIERYGRSGAFLYCDPPYVGAEAVYKGPAFSEADHRDLGTLLNAKEARVALSYYTCELVDELYPPDRWRRVEKRWKCVLANPKVTPDADHERTELLLLNHDPPAQKQLFETQEKSG